MPQSFDVIICGGGLVGASLALALKPAGLRVAVIEPQRQERAVNDDTWDSRIYAISPGSAAFLESCGIWQGVSPERIARVEEMRIFGDDESSLLNFSAYDAGLREVAYIVENRLLQRAGWACIENSDHIRAFCPARGVALAWNDGRIELRLDDDTDLEAKLIVGADGSDSWLRAAGGIKARARDYGQLGVVANFAAEHRHRSTAYQWFHRDGVLALLPLPGQRVSMVWSTTESRARDLLALSLDDLADLVGTASRYELGRLRPVTAPMAFPLRIQRVDKLVKMRLALVGDAAHNLHPLAGQGVNLGFRDARKLAEVLCDRGVQTDCGDYALLRRYERARKEDVFTMQFATDGLQKLFNNEMVILSWARNLGLKLVNRQPQLKNLLIRQAIS